MRLDVIRSLQCFEDDFPFEFYHCLLERELAGEDIFAQRIGTDIRFQRRGEVFGCDGRPIGPDECLLDHILEFSDVTGPVVLGQELHRLLREFLVRSLVLLKPLGQKMFRE